ncbi:MAG: hypothetical protein WAN65_22755, partial [Candidatus Sulfotelmatobacter sp.]
MAQFTIRDIMPQSHSDETNQDSEPSIGVNLADPTQIVISTFTPPDPGQVNGPVFYSEDGGASWHLSFIVPGGEPGDQTFAFGETSNQFYGAILDQSDNMDELSTSDPFVAGTMATPESLPQPQDQPFISATTVRFGPEAGKDRTYVGFNDQNEWATGKTSAVSICLDALATTPTFTTAFLEKRSTPTWLYSGSGFVQDGPQVRVAIHADGTLYGIFNGVRTFDFTTSNVTADVVVVRDDNWASGSDPFTALLDPIDGISGYRVQTGVPLLWSPHAGTLGQERVFGSFAIAVHPLDSDIVYITWAQLVSGVQTLYVQSSSNRGVDWSPVLYTVTGASNSAVAIAVNGKIGLMYQKYVGTPPNDTWETHFAESINGTVWTDTIIADTPASTPVVVTLPYLGDYLEMLAVGQNFYGTFCANNTPNPANFPATPATASNPNGAIFLRNTTTSAPWNLLGSDGTTVVLASIDPFFVQVTEVAASSAFYVRDWTDSATSGDTGLEPSNHLVFWTTSDVWNQYSSTTPNPPNSNNQPVTQNAQAGSNNYLFARIQRNVLPPSGSGSTTVTAHFLVSEFGTGSNFVDWLFSDPTDPDITFPSTTDVTVTFADTDLGPLITLPFTWTLGSTTSDHLCVAVEIFAPDSPMLAPGLTGQTPGTSAESASILYDNHKAQRNLQVNQATGGSRGSVWYGIIHNGDLTVLDKVMGLVGAAGDVPEGTTIEIVTERGTVLKQPFTNWGRVTLSSMQPGENRWIGITLPVPPNTANTVSIADMKGDLASAGFTISAQPAPIGQVIASATASNQQIINRLVQGFQIPIAEAGGETHREHERWEGGAEFHERVVAKTREFEIEVDVRLRGREREKERAESQNPPKITTANYESYALAQVKILAATLSQLGGGDPFGIGAALSDMTAAAGDLAALVTAHITALNKFDAFLTMLQKAQGDRADILQMTRWHAQLCARPALAALAAT